MKSFLKKIFLFSKNHNGATVLEFTITLPIVVYLLFFLIEVWRLKTVQTAIDSIAQEFCISFMLTRSTTSTNGLNGVGQSLLNFDGIIKKYKPNYIDEKDISYYFTVFKDANELYINKSNIPVYWPVSEASTSSNIILKSSIKQQDNQNSNQILLNNLESSIKQQDNQNSNQILLNNYKRPELGQVGEMADTFFLRNTSFVVTVVLKYTFSSAFVAKLFGGGTNTSSDNIFLIWSRGIGFCR